MGNGRSQYDKKDVHASGPRPGFPEDSVGETSSRFRIKLAHPAIGAEEVAAAAEALMSGVLTNGPHTIAFEEAFAIRHGVSFAVAFANGTVALSAIYLA